MYRYIEPEVSGGFGKDTQIDRSVHPPIVKKLHFEFDGWLGDDIIVVFPCFLVTDLLKNKIESEKCTGVVFESIKVSKSQHFFDFYPDSQLPDFYWAKIEGEFEIDDLFIGGDYRLIISEKVFTILTLFNIENALIDIM